MEEITIGNSNPRQRAGKGSPVERNNDEFDDSIGREDLRVVILLFAKPLAGGSFFFEPG